MNKHCACGWCNYEVFKKT